MIIPNFSNFILLFMSTFNSYVRITYIQLNNY